MKKVCCFTLAFCVLMATGSLVLSQTCEDILTLEDSIKIALENNLTLQSSRRDVSATDFAKKSSRGNFLPKIEAEAGYFKLDEAPTADFGGFMQMMSQSSSSGEEETNGHSYEVELGEDYIFEWKVRAAQPLTSLYPVYQAYKISSHNAKRALITHDLVRNDIIYNVKKAYYTVLKSQKFREVSEQGVNQVQAHVDNAQHFFQVGMIPKNDLLQAEVGLAQIKENLIKAENVVQMSMSFFNNLLGYDVRRETILQEMTDYTTLDLTLDDCQSLAHKNRLELKIIEQQTEMAQRAKALEIYNYFPDTALVWECQETDGSLFADERSWMIGVAAKWSIWDWGRTKYAVDEADEIIAKVKLEKKRLVDAITLEVKNGYLQVEEALKRILVSQKSIEQAEENFRIVNEKYLSNMVTSTDVLDAQITLTQAKTSYFGALYDYNIAYSFLEKAVGKNNSIRE